MSLILTVAALVLFISIVYSEMVKREKEGEPSLCNPPQIENGQLIKLDGLDHNHIVYRLKCDDEYDTSSKGTNISCIRGIWSHIDHHCKAHHSRKLNMLLLTCVLPSVAAVIIIVIVIICIMRKKRSVQPVPKWTKNKEEREKKYSSEVQEKVYKDLVETSRLSFRFPFFRPKGHSTGKKPIFVEEGGYLVPKRQRKHYDSTDARKNENHQNQSDSLGASATKVETEIATKCDVLPTEIVTECEVLPTDIATKCEALQREVIKELVCKQAERVFSSNGKAESKSENLSKIPRSNPICKTLGACGKIEEPSQKSNDLKPKHTYENLETRDDIVSKEMMTQQDYIDERSNELQARNMKHQVDVSANYSLSPFCSRNTFTKQDNVILVHSPNERGDTSVTKSKENLQSGDEFCISKPNPQLQENKCDVPGKSIVEPQTILAKHVISSGDQTYVQMADIVTHKEPISCENKPPKEKHLYCNINVDHSDSADKVEEICYETPPRPLHTYANLQFS